MSEQEIDQYLAALDEPKRSTLEALRRSILEVVPDAEQCISYGMPAFRLQGKVVAGFAAFKHLSYLPHSGSVLAGARRRPRRLRADEGLPALRDRQAAPEAPREEAHHDTGCNSSSCNSHSGAGALCRGTSDRPASLPG